MLLGSNKTGNVAVPFLESVTPVYSYGVQVAFASMFGTLLEICAKAGRSSGVVEAAQGLARDRGYQAGPVGSCPGRWASIDCAEFFSGDDPALQQGSEHSIDQGTSCESHA